MKRKAIISVLTITIVILMVLCTIPSGTSDSSATRQTNLAYGAKGSTSVGGSSAYGYGPERLNGGVLFAQQFSWISTPSPGSRPNNAWVKYTWPTPVSISSFKIFNGYWQQIGPHGPGFRYLYGAQVQIWNGFTYQTIMTYSGQTAPFYEIQLTSSVTTTELRLYDLRGWTRPGHENPQDYNPAIAEWEVYGPSGIAADVRLEPQSLNLDSMGNWVNVKVEGFPDNPEHSPMDTDGQTIAVGGVGVDLKFGTYNNNRWTGKADRLLVEDSIGAPGDEVEVQVQGNLNDGTPFIGKAVIKAL
ncbi:MAG: hypothetical protein KAJ51_00760 [Thermoplasmata archaeon]|nr:hypothetical protein [Thermoplasmata archaeon]